MKFFLEDIFSHAHESTVACIRLPTENKISQSFITENDFSYQKDNNVFF